MTARQDRRAAAATLLGFIAASFARSTGALVVIVEAAEQGLDDSDGPIAMICDDHSAVLSVETRTLARRHAVAPEQWCEDCAAAVDEHQG